MWPTATLFLALLAAGLGDDTSVGPMFIKEPPNRVDFSNTTGAVIECTARGNPTPEIIWVRSDGTAVGDVPGLRQVLANGNLVFPPFRAEDYRQEVHAQVYICLAKNTVGTIHSRDVNVRAVVNQPYDGRVIDEYILRGNSAVLKCLVPSFVADFIEVVGWEISDGQTFLASDTEDIYDGKYLVLPSGELHIKDVGPEDGQKSYQCRTKHRLTGETRLSATKGRLVITDPIGSVAPKFPTLDKGSIFDVKEGLSYTLICPSQAFPVPTFRWYKFVEGTSKKQAVVMNDRVKQVSGTLIIREAKVEDSGKYLCVVNNSVGGESVETVLTVTAPLSASIEPSVQTVDFGRPATMSCNFEGNPVKTLSWLKDGKVLPNKEAMLKIESVRKEDRGMYQCFVRNEQESAQASAELKLGSRFEPPLIKDYFNNETLQPGAYLKLKCVAKGNPIPEITWYLDGKKLIKSDRQQIGQYTSLASDVISHLNISSVQPNDGGLYKCVASSKVGVTEHAERINIYGQPFVRPMEKKAIVAGETLVVTCPYAGYPIDSIIWERDGRALPINRKQKVFPNGTLIIENLERLSDQATYTCVVKNSQGYTSRGTLDVQVMVAPKLMPFSFGGKSLQEGTSTTLQCTVSEGDLPLHIVWLFNGQELEESDTVSVSKLGRRGSALIIDSLTSKNVGNYTCLVKNPAGSQSYTAPLFVNVPPRWIIEPTDKAFAQGSDAKVECKADGFPRPAVTWKRATGDSPGDYKDLKPNNPDVKVEEGTLLIHNIQKTSEGYYLCEAVNGIGSGLSAVIMISVQAPPQFDVKSRNQTARINDPTVLQCEAKGEKPIGIIWNMNNKRLDPKSDIRYTIREEILPHGVLSDLSIRTTGREDSASFTCVATNSFGSDDTSINLIVQEVPEAPNGLKVLDKSGRTVQLSWSAPYDGNSPIKRYLIEYKVSKGKWDNDIDRVMVPGHQTMESVPNLSPATTYHMRVVAENEVGTSEPSEPVMIITAEEAPSGPPTNVKVEAMDQVTLKVTWNPPEKEHWNGEILGYYVGYKLSNSDKPYLFETVEFSKEEGKEHHLLINSLKTYTQYSVVVQAFNKLGAGPTTEEIKQYTAEGTPNEPPKDPTCTTLTSQTIRISWNPPNLATANGVIRGYKVIYGPTENWYDEKSKDSKITQASETIIHGLKKYTNYTMQVLAYTAGGDGVRSAPIHCQTEQDVPDSPTAIKALAMSEDSILISWKPPAQPNGIISQYAVYIKEESKGRKPDDVRSQKIPPYQMTYEASGLNKDEKYEFWVTASTNIGEGRPSKPVILTPNNKVPAKIASFDSKFTATYHEDVKLPCLTVGKPTPDITWKIKGVTFETNDRMQQLPEGSLLIKSVTRTDAGEYSCHVQNSFGHDSVTHHLIILAPPHMPQVTLTSTTTNSITLKIKPNPQDVEPVHGFTVKYKPEFGEWETAQLPPTIHKYTLENLWCGSRYMISVTAYNSIGTGDESDILNTRTKGSKPIIPDASRFIEVSTNSITLHLSTWSDGGCPMLYFVVEHKKKISTEWNQVSNNVKPGGNFVVLDLDPATWYNLRVTAHNNAGFAVAEYEFATLTITGGTIAPAREVPDSGYGPDSPIRILLSNLNLVVPVISAMLVIIVAIIVVCFLRGKGSPHKDDIVYNQSMVGGNTIDKRCPDLHDELGYIPPPNRKLPPVPGSNYNTCERIKRGRGGLCSGHTTWDPRRHMYEELASHGPCRTRLGRCPGSDETMYHRAGMDDDICPYATFHLLGFREEMDPSKAMQFQTFPHQNGHCGTLGPGNGTTTAHHRSGSQSMPRNGRYSRAGVNSTFSPEYDDPANCTEDDPYGSQYTPYGAPYDHYSSRNSLGRRSVGSPRNLPISGSPEPPPPPPRNHDNSSSANESKESNEMSEAECDRDQLLNRSYPVSTRNNSKDGMTTEEMRKLIERNEGGPQQFQNGGLTAYDTVAV
nr:Down syndrome cell adhesion molecule-like protein Dscam2 isoform X38 [Halyomorpha halys]